VAKRNKSALKANRQNVKRREANRRLRSKLRTGLKTLRKTVDSTDKAAASTALQEATKGMIHRNTAARYKSRLSARVAK